MTKECANQTSAALHQSQKVRYNLTYDSDSNDHVTSDISKDGEEKNHDATYIYKVKNPIEINNVTQSTIYRKRDLANQCNSGPIMNGVLTYINNECELIRRF